ncbi:MAG: nucleotide exchange factor GrpE [Thermoleophilaceae bacterium]|nr:nucleotide exchange factor GrpE [Thermoleophilaceae bacterium]
MPGDPEKTPTERPDPAEPGGDEDPAVEREIDEATERQGEDAAPEPVEPAEPDPSAPSGAAGDGAPAEDYLALAQRTQADFENYRKRASREISEAGARARAGLVRELLPVVDNLERALDSAPDDDPMAAGVRLVHSDLLGLLQRSGIEPFAPAGEQFDPTMHEAISMREGETSGLVLDVVEKGYKLNGSILRPARVVVAA